MTNPDLSGTSIKTTMTKDNELRHTFKNDIQTISRSGGKNLGVKLKIEVPLVS